jgi:hypothetical protein
MAAASFPILPQHPAVPVLPEVLLEASALETGCLTRKKQGTKELIKVYTLKAWVAQMAPENC